MKKITGVLPALVTPLLEDETINVPVVGQLIESMMKQGADGFYVGGATGEGIALRQEVREQLAEEAVKVIGGRVPAIIHIASANFSEAIALAKHAEKIGADAISAIPPLFFQYDEDDVYNYYKAIAESTSLPVIIYYNPAAGFKVNAEFAARMFEIDNISGIKWTSSDYFGMIKLKELTKGEMNIINGPDEMLLMGLAAGADAGIGTTYNFMLPLYKKIYESFRSGRIEEARETQTKADMVIRAIAKYTTIPAAKAVMEKLGFAVGNAAFPMKRYDDAMKEKIFNELLAAGLEA